MPVTLPRQLHPSVMPARAASPETPISSASKLSFAASGFTLCPLTCFSATQLPLPPESNFQLWRSLSSLAHQRCPLFCTRTWKRVRISSQEGIRTHFALCSGLSVCLRHDNGDGCGIQCVAVNKAKVYGYWRLKLCILAALAVEFYCPWEPCESTWRLITIGFRKAHAVYFVGLERPLHHGSCK